MSWTVTYRIERQEPWSDEDLPKLRQHFQSWQRKLKATSYGLHARKGNVLIGSSEQGSETSAADVVTIIQALRELEKIFGAQAWVEDTYYLEGPTRPSEVDLEDLEARVKKDALTAPPVAAEPDSDDVDLPEVAPEPPTPVRAAREPLDPEVQKLLDRARADFDIWKKSQQGK